MKKLVSSFLVVTLLTLIFTVTAFASPNSEKSKLCYFVGETGVYKFSEEQYDEASNKNNWEEIVHRDEVRALPSTVGSRSTVDHELLQEVTPIARQTGYWSIDSNKVPQGYRTTYSMPGGGSFRVGEKEEFECEMTPNKSCYITVGATGSKEWHTDEYYDTEDYSGIIIHTSSTGSYKPYVENTRNKFDIYVDGYVNVY